MLADVLKTFDKILQKKGEEYITDSYIPADGEYIIVEPMQDGFQILDTIQVKQDKKTKEIDRTNPYFQDFICKADYMSRLLDMNKPIDSKKIIHSNNYLSFFIKKDNINHKKLTNDIITNYYAICKNPRIKYKKTKTKQLYEAIEKKNGQADEEVITRIEKWIKDHIFTLVDEENKDKSYLKIFFYYDLEVYRKESEKYILTNIYNSTDYNTTVNDQIYGLPNDNMGLNSKKPYLENKTRKTHVPYLLSQDNVLLQKKFLDFLMNQVSNRKINIYVNEEEIKALSQDEILETDFQGYYLRIKKGKEVEIHDFDTVDHYTPHIRPMEVMNVLDLKESRMEYSTIYGMEKMKNLVNQVFFSKFLTSNYFTEAKDLRMNDNVLKKNLLFCRNALFAWFYKGNRNNVWKVLKQSSLDLIKGSIQNGYLLKASEQFNLRCSLKKYFEGGKNMADVLMQLKDILRTKISGEGTQPIANDREYFFAVGQLANYFISLHKGKKKVHSLANPIINAKTDKQVKNELRKLYKKYNYTINTGYQKFRNLYAMVSGYIPEGNMEEDLIIAGYLHSNLLYEKSNKEDKINE